MKAFYFSEESNRLEDDHAAVLLKDPPLSLLEALQYAKGPILHFTDLNKEENKVNIHEFDATKLLTKFARQQALINVEKIKPYCQEEDYNLILRHLNSDKPSASLSYEHDNWSESQSGSEALAWALLYAAESAARSARQAVKCIDMSATLQEKEKALSIQAAAESVLVATWSKRSVVQSARLASLWALRSAGWPEDRSSVELMLKAMAVEATGWEI